VSNGARILMLLYASGDPAKYWELHMVSGHEELTQSMADILTYAISRDDIHFKGQTHLVKADEAIKDEKQLKLARLKYTGNWDPEPGAWRRMAAILHNEQKISLLIEPVTLGENKLDAAMYPLAHLTGTAAMKFPEPALAEIKKYVEAGGTLLIDSCGGGTAFRADLEPAIAKLFGKTEIPVLATANALFTTDPKITDVSYRPFARKTLGQQTNTPLLRGLDMDKRTAVYFSREDLSAGMVGQSVDGIIGYSPATTRQLIQHLLMTLASKATPLNTEPPKPQ